MDGAAAGVIADHAPGVDRAGGDDKPDLAIADRARRIAQRRLGLPLGWL